MSDLLYDATLPDGIYEINGSRTENYTDTEFTAHIDFICPWEKRTYYVDELMERVYPHHILLDNETNEATTNFYKLYFPAVAMSVNVTNMGAEGVQVDTTNILSYQPYTKAKLSVDYKAIARPGNWSIQESISPNFGMRQLPSWGYYWRSDGSPILDNESPAVQEVKVEIQRTISGVRQIPAWFYDLGGMVNNNPWCDLITGVSYLPDTLLFVPSNMQRNITYNRGDDDCIWTISFAIKWNPIGWNSFRRPHGVDMIMRNGAPQYFYPRIDFPTLLVSADDQIFGDPYYVRLNTINGGVVGIYVDENGEAVESSIPEIESEDEEEE